MRDDSFATVVALGRSGESIQIEGVHIANAIFLFLASLLN